MDRLPAFVSEKLADLIEVRDQVRSWAQAAMNRAEADRHRVGGIKLQLQASRGINIPMVGAQVGPTPEQLSEVQREIGELEVKIQASVDEFARRRQYADLADGVLNHVRDWLLRLPEGTVLDQVPVPLANGDAKKLLDLVRRDLAEVQSKLARLNALPQPLPEIEARIRAWVQSRAAAQQVIVRAPRGGQPLVVDIGVSSVLGPSMARIDPLTLAARLDPEAMAEMLITEAQRHPFAGQGISDAAFDDQVATLSDKLDQLGRSEEALISKLLKDQPTAVTRRSDVKPEHVLCCRVGKPQQRVAA